MRASTKLSYRLHQHVVLAIEQPRPGVLVQGFHIFSGAGSEPVFRHAAARVPLPDLHKVPAQPQSWEISLGRRTLGFQADPL